MVLAKAKSDAMSPVRHFDPAMDGGFAGKPVIGLITLSTDCVTEHELRLMAPADKIVISATRIKTRNPLTVSILREHVDEIGKAVSFLIRSKPQKRVRLCL